MGKRRSSNHQKLASGIAVTKSAGKITAMTDENTLPDDLTPIEREALGEPVASIEPAPEPTERQEDILPPLRAEAPNAGPMLAQLAAQQDMWAAKFDDGDITSREYAAGLEKLADKREEIRWASRKAELSQELVQGQRMNNWSKAVQQFMATDGKQIAANVDANGRPGPLLIGLDAAVKKAHGNPVNRGLSDKAILAKAHRAFTDELHATFGRPESPTGGADLGALNKLGPLELEDALLQMTPAERDHYLQ